jgi:hypothetical protein
MVVNSFCYSSVTLRVNAGEVVYFGDVDVTPYIAAKRADGGPFYFGMP